ncbi:MAG: hypothetical protein PHQ32_02560 [Firmicutes bacterium]|nr:hypothetical protein [Bacillota bacterium]
MNSKDYLNNLVKLIKLSDNFDDRLLTITETNNKNDNYLDLEINGQKVLRFPTWLNYNDSNYFIELHKDVSNTIDNLNEKVKVKNPLWLIYPLTFITESEITNNIIKIYDWYYLNILPADTFACCQLYMECSNEKSCLHKDKIFRTRCIYKRNLEKNLIFFGKNMNI